MYEIKNETIKKWLRRMIPVLLTILFCVTSCLSLVTILRMQGNARVVNYTGIIRGATQRLVKQELNGLANDALIQKLDGILEEFTSGKGENGLIALPDINYQVFLKQLRQSWAELKLEIQQVRRTGDGQRLFALSEDYFDLADKTVSAAEAYSEKSVGRATIILLWLNGGLVLFVALFWFYGWRQKKIQTALDMAKHANQAKSEFLSRMSHEIRTPMNGIIGMTEIAYTSLNDQEQIKRCLNNIRQSSQYLLALINDILDMSRIESGKIELEHQLFSLSDMLEQIDSMFRQKAADDGVKFLVSQDGLAVHTAIGDRLRISQILINIVSNAIKFTPEGGQVVLNAQQIESTEQDITLEFTVTDTGIGISQEFQDRIFEPFEQEQAATSRRYGGTGLGLAISNNFVKMMGGTLTLHSQPGKGSQFIIRLTLPKASIEPGQSSSQAPEKKPLADLAGTQILLAEDHPINAEIIRILLEKNGAQVTLATNGKEAVQLFTAVPEKNYSLILMDIQMPLMGGLEASRTIRKMARKDAVSIPIIGLSANAFQADIDKALQSGMNGYLSKPIDVTKLFDTIGKFI